jgi:hypothetical protein
MRELTELFQAQVSKKQKGPPKKLSRASSSFEESARSILRQISAVRELLVGQSAAYVGSNRHLEPGGFLGDAEQEAIDTEAHKSIEECRTLLHALVETVNRE